MLRFGFILHVLWCILLIKLQICVGDLIWGYCNQPIWHNILRISQNGQLVQFGLIKLTLQVFFFGRKRDFKLLILRCFKYLCTISWPKIIIVPQQISCRFLTCIPRSWTWLFVPVNLTLRDNIGRINQIECAYPWRFRRTWRLKLNRVLFVLKVIIGANLIYNLFALVILLVWNFVGCWSCFNLLDGRFYGQVMFRESRILTCSYWLQCVVICNLDRLFLQLLLIIVFNIFI